jgi:hypothetical protein
MIALGYSPETAAAAFEPSLSANCIRKALKSGALVSHRVSKSRVILADDLIAFVRSQPNYRVPTRKTK